MYFTSCQVKKWIKLKKNLKKQGSTEICERFEARIDVLEKKEKGAKYSFDKDGVRPGTVHDREFDPET